MMMPLKVFVVDVTSTRLVVPPSSTEPAPLRSWTFAARTPLVPAIVAVVVAAPTSRVAPLSTLTSPEPLIVPAVFSFSVPFLISVLLV